MTTLVIPKDIDLFKRKLYDDIGEPVDSRDEAKSIQVKKKLVGRQNRKPRYGRRTTGLIGVGNASFRMAQIARLKTTSEKY